MPDTRPIPLRLTPERLTEFCRQIRQRSGDPAQALHALTTLQAFLAVCVEDDGHSGYREARSELEAQLEALRDDLLDRHADRIADALRRQDVAAISGSFGALSRSGFANAAARAWAAVAVAERPDRLRWLETWIRDARQRACAAGRYPDAPDFRAAGIALEDCLALEELHGVVRRPGGAVE